MVLPVGGNQPIWNNHFDPGLAKDSEEKERARLEAINADYLSDEEFNARLGQLNEEALTDEQINELYDQDPPSDEEPFPFTDYEMNVLLDQDLCKIDCDNTLEFLVQKTDAGRASSWVVDFKDYIIEAKTKAILLNLQTVVDRQSREDIKKTILPSVQKDHGSFQDYDDLFRETRFTSFRRETNFDDQDFFGRSGSTLETINKMISRLTSLLFGFETSQNRSEGQRSFEEMENDLHADRNKWDAELGHAYQDYYRENIEEAFSLAESLINERKDYAKTVLYQRIALYATAVFAVVGMFTGKKILTYVGLSLSAVSLIWMFREHILSSYREAKLAAELQSSVEFLEEIGPKNIISDP